jgi:hypothetical protein
MGLRKPIKVYVDGFRIDTIVPMPGSGEDLKAAALTPKVRAALEGLQVADFSFVPAETCPRFILITTELKKSK